MGVHSTFTPDMGNKICKLIEDGFTFRKIEAMEGMPANTTILRWLSEGDTDIASNKPDTPKANFRRQYARSKSIQCHVIAEETLDISDDNSLDKVVDKEGNLVSNPANVQRDRLRVDTRKWHVSKLMPKIYGERVLNDHTSSDGTMSPMTSDDREIIARYMAEKKSITKGE